ncbi:hypothetical protein PHAVU_008G272200 [Phaseolus vulgaris]|uniref:F-box domain-containing protein n=1 Tax=Phaseolus vulgaris TaxID=3885 RepID=V7B943_PHAVU|nr:hypothetical protein PHAVU_008G272200g [Phaseolus vulgaris]ESW14334.1 hypothetical protein PHAVU_008G272200g [Phaseolus vulgaris]
MKRGNFSLLTTEDRLSQLSDELLLKILSFLDVRFVVQTCFLSKRWRSLPMLNLDDSLFEIMYSIIDYVTHTLSISTTIQLLLYDCRFECGMGDSLNLFEECVNLQYLYFHSCVYYGDVKNFIISVSQLIQLDISGFRVDEMFDEDCELVTPMFKYFKYHDSNLYSFFQLVILIMVLSRFPDIFEDQSSPFTRMQTFELINDVTFTSGIPRAVKAYLFSETS